MAGSSLFCKKAGHVKTSWLFYLFLFTIFWAPIPLGSNRPWAWGLLEILAFAITASALILYKESLFNTLKNNKYAIAVC